MLRRSVSMRRGSWATSLLRRLVRRFLARCAAPIPRTEGVTLIPSDLELSGWAKPYTLTPHVRRLAMIAALREIERDKVAGDVVECGVWRGGNIMLARWIAPDRVCWLYDTFDGMSEPGPEDLRRSGSSAINDYARRKRADKPWCRATLEEVEICLRQTDAFDASKLRFVVGDVVETLQVHRPTEIALLRLDTDWYASTKAELETLYPLLVLGGVLIVDDYGHWAGARQAVDEYFADQNVSFEAIDYAAISLKKERV